MNPELQRNFWLEYSLNRLLMLPIILGMIFYIVYLLSGELAQAANLTAKACFVFFAIIWASRQLSDSLIEEVRQHTWDWQRISSISPWSLLWGKWLGSTLYSWYGATLSLIIMIASSSLSLQTNVYELVAMICCALFGQGIALLVCLQMFKRDRTLIRFHSHLAHLSGVISALVLITIVWTSENTWFEHWYNIEANHQTFILLSLCTFCFWVILGNYRLISDDLQISNSGGAWFSFVLFSLFYSSGIMQTPFSGLGFFAAMALSYLMLILEGSKPSRLRQLTTEISQNKWKKVAELTPCWMIGLIPTGIYLVILVFTTAEQDMLFFKQELHFFYIALFLFFLRDVGIVTWIQKTHKSKRSDASILLYFVIIYALLPALFTALSLFGALQAIISTPSVISCLAAAVQLLGLAFISWPYIRPNALMKPTDPTHH
ncbi:MAG: hypothetical protein Q9M28_05775 [Mariprofundaceae bacterium]|nr:hypothetical protein [Mariprofundaceae bacterium]